jgi:hypothetical protein
MEGAEMVSGKQAFPVDELGFELANQVPSPPKTSAACPDNLTPSDCEWPDVL